MPVPPDTTPAGLAAGRASEPAPALVADASGAAGLVAGAPFVVRRIGNPNYRPPLAAAPGIRPGAVSRMRALDHFGAELFHHGSGGVGSTTQWQITGGEQYRSDAAMDLAAAGGQRAGRSEFQALRLSGRRGGLSGGLGDNEPLVLARLAFLQRLRGAVLRFADCRETQWLALGGIPTPIPGMPTPRLGLGGVMIDGFRHEEGALSLTVMGFGRGRPPRAPLPAADPDSLPGRGGVAALGWRAPAAGGWLAGRLGAQLHDLSGHRVLAAQHALEWSLGTPGLVVSASDERGTRHARLLGTDRFAEAPRREDRWNLLARFASGRAESHFTGVVREGGDLALVTRTVQWGTSGSFGRSAWYGGVDAVWDRRGPAAAAERRVSLHAGGLLPRGNALLARIEHARRPGLPGSLAALAEGSLPLPRGGRLELEPRLGWSDGLLQQGQMTTRVSWPLGVRSARITGSVAVGAARDDGFRGGVREAALALSCSPRLRDRGEVEVRRLDQDGRAAIETSLAYDAMVERYETLGGWVAGRDTGRVTVQVVRSGNGSGVSDVVVSLDGHALRFTDLDGVARFEHVAPGIHLVAVEERSLPAHHQVASSSRVFVTVERGRVPEPVRFTIARAERRVKF